jgi:hypothetical protein
MSSSKILYVNPSLFNKANLVITDPVTSKMTVAGKEITNVSSKILYRDTAGVPREWYTTGTPQRVFGFNLNYEYAKEETDDTINGMQLCYPESSLQTHTNPAPEELAVINMNDAIHEALCEKAEAELDIKPTRIGAAARSMISSAKNDGDIQSAVKPISDYPTIKDSKTKEKDLSKPRRMYMKLVTKGKGKEMQVFTRVKGPGNRLHNAREFVNTRGELTPAFQYDSVFWGMHGQTSNYGVSIKVKLLEANFTPIANAAIPAFNLLGDNDAPESELESIPTAPSSIVVNNEPDNSFAENTNPADDLKATVTPSTPQQPAASTAATPTTAVKKVVVKKKVTAVPAQ